MVREPARWCRRGADGFVLSIHAQPGGKRTQVVGVHGEALKIRVQAPALEGRANDALVEFIAARLGIAKRDVLLVGGARSREKRVRVPLASDPALLSPPGP